MYKHLARFTHSSPVSPSGNHWQNLHSRRCTSMAQTGHPRVLVARPAPGSKGKVVDRERPDTDRVIFHSHLLFKRCSTFTLQDVYLHYDRAKLSLFPTTSQYLGTWSSQKWEFVDSHIDWKSSHLIKTRRNFKPVTSIVQERKTVWFFCQRNVDYLIAKTKQWQTKICFRFVKEIIMIPTNLNPNCSAKLGKTNCTTTC